MPAVPAVPDHHFFDLQTVPAVPDIQKLFLWTNPGVNRVSKINVYFIVENRFVYLTTKILLDSRNFQKQMDEEIELAKREALLGLDEQWK